MSDDLNLEDLAHAWKEIDMQPLEIALSTGKLRSKTALSLGFMSLLSTVLFAVLFDLVFVAGGPPGVRLSLAVLVAFTTVSFLVFFARQWRSTRKVDELLLGSPADLVRGRIVLLEMELQAWRGPIARFFEVVVGGGSILFGWWAAIASGVPWMMVPPTLGFAGVVAYGRLWRVPALTEEIASLETLADALGS